MIREFWRGLAIWKNSMWFIDEGGEYPYIFGSAHPSKFGMWLIKKWLDRITVISLLDYQANYSGATGISQFCFPIKDFEAPTLQQIKNVIDVILDSDDPIVIHCEGGVGRTGTMAVAYWISQGFTPLQALREVRSRKPWAVETDEQWASVVAYKKELRRAEKAGVKA